MSYFSKKTRLRIAITSLFLFICMNIVAYFHAYKFTHFADTSSEKTKNAKKMGFGEKLQTLVFGINNPKPQNKIQPTRPYETVYLQSRQKIECWYIKVDSSKGTVIMFHGFSGSKSAMLDKAEIFNALGYNTFLVDFVGTGGSEGNETTIGFKEAEDVKISLDFIQKTEKNAILFGSSMGAAAILRAAASYQIQPNAAILECPFGSMYKTTCARFSQMKVPCFPMAGLLLFWGGAQNDFWAFSHNPEEYAKSVRFPTLLLYGAKDAEVSKAETETIFANLQGKKVLQIYEEAGHDNYLIHYKAQWIQNITDFLAGQ